jgi:hypothetical protein
MHSEERLETRAIAVANTKAIFAVLKILIENGTIDESRFSSLIKEDIKNFESFGYNEYADTLRHLFDLPILKN